MDARIGAKMVKFGLNRSSVNDQETKVTGIGEWNMAAITGVNEALQWIMRVIVSSGRMVDAYIGGGGQGGRRVKKSSGML